MGILSTASTTLLAATSSSRMPPVTARAAGLSSVSSHLVCAVAGLSLAVNVLGSWVCCSVYVLGLVDDCRC
jgi:hypothetical protein